MARKSKYTPETVKMITDALKLGATYGMACGYAGISHETFCQWRNTKPEFSEAVKKAEGTAAVGWLLRIEQAANNGSWQAAAWKLERKFPDDFGRTVSDVRHSVTVQDEAQRLAARYGLPLDAILAEAEQILAEAGGGTP